MTDSVVMSILFSFALDPVLSRLLYTDYYPWPLLVSPQPMFSIVTAPIWITHDRPKGRKPNISDILFIRTSWNWDSSHNRTPLVVPRFISVVTKANLLPASIGNASAVYSKSPQQITTWCGIILSTNFGDFKNRPTDSRLSLDRNCANLLDDFRFVLGKSRSWQKGCLFFFAFLSF